MMLKARVLCQGVSGWIGRLGGRGGRTPMMMRASSPLKASVTYTAFFGTPEPGLTCARNAWNGKPWGVLDGMSSCGSGLYTLSRAKAKICREEVVT